MTTTTNTKSAARRSRVSELNTTLETRRRELLDEVHIKLRDARIGSKTCEEVHETVQRRERLMAQRRGSVALFVELAN